MKVIRGVLDEAGYLPKQISVVEPNVAAKAARGREGVAAHQQRHAGRSGVVIGDHAGFQQGVASDLVARRDEVGAVPGEEDNRAYGRRERADALQLEDETRIA